MLMRNEINSKIILILMAGLFLSPVSSPADDTPLVIKAAKIHTISHGIIENGAVLIESGKIQAAGSHIQIPQNSKVMDAGEAWLLPGLIESHSTMGTGSRYGGSNTDETSHPNTAQLSILDAVNPFDKNFQYLLQAGITTLMLTPGRMNVIGGQTAVVKPEGKTVMDMTIKSPAGVKISLGEGPKTTYGKKGRLPSTRMGSAYVLRKALWDARRYLEKWQEYRKEKGKIKRPKKDMQLEPLARLLEKEMTAFIECYRADDIMTALRITDEFNLQTVLVGCSEGYKIPREIARRNIPVIVSPFGVGPRRMETQNLTQSNAAVLKKSGVKIAIKADESLGIGNIRELPLLAALAVKGGLDRETALKAITLNPAEILGVGGQIGSLDPGKDADLILFDGDPLDYRTRVKQVFLDGKSVYKR